MDAGDGRRFGLANPSRSALNLRYVRKCFLAASDLARICLSVKATDTLLGKNNVKCKTTVGILVDSERNLSQFFKLQFLLFLDVVFCI